MAQDPVIDQWQRVFHPNAPDSPRGPELHARINDQQSALVYVEAKWTASIGSGKGQDDVPADQIVLRRDSLRKDPALVDDVRTFAVLGISNKAPDLTQWHEAPAVHRSVTVAWLTWDDLASALRIGRPRSSRITSPGSGSK